MSTEEPRMLFNQPLSVLIAYSSTAILLTQIFALMFITTFFMYVVELCLCFSMVFVLSLGLKQGKKGHVMAYALYLSMYIFWVAFGMIFYIWAYSFWANHRCPNPEKATTTLAPELCNNGITAGDIAFLVLCIVSCTVSVILCCYQLRLLFLFLTMMARQRAQRQFNVSYQTTMGQTPVPNPPPQYTTSFEPSTTATQQQAGPLPEKPPIYTPAPESTPVTSLNPPDLLNFPTPHEQTTTLTINETTVPSTPPTYDASQQQQQPETQQQQQNQQHANPEETLPPPHEYDDVAPEEFVPSVSNPFVQDMEVRTGNHDQVTAEPKPQTTDQFETVILDNGSKSVDSAHKLDLLD